MKPHILILAAGQGKRMRSQLPKVLHPVLHKPLLHHVIDTAKSLPHSSISIVVGHGEAEVRTACANYEGLQFFRQERQLGTADAVKAAMPFLSTKSGSLLVLSGDVILLQSQTLQNLLGCHREGGATLLTAVLKTPRGYGRILRDARNSVIAIREEADASPAEREITEVNTGIYVFDIAKLSTALGGLTAANKQGEYYLTDVVSYFVQNGVPVGSDCLADPREAEGINDRVQLAEVDKILRLRINNHWMQQGVTLVDPESTRISPDCHIGTDVVIEPNVTIISSRLGAGTLVEAGCRLVSTEVGESCVIKQGSYLTESAIGARSQIGPYAHLRPQSLLATDVKIGNFVEVKNSSIGAGSKASHLTYLGDAEVGKNVNLGCGFITCNFDGGPKKQKTIIEDDVFVGSDSQAVAPVRLERGSYIASGTTITKNVSAGSLAISRGKQINKEGYAVRLAALRNNVKKK